METKTVSARVPVKFANELKNWTSANGKTVSEHLVDVFATLDNETFLPKTNEVEVEEETQGILLSLGGGGAIALLTYKGIMALLNEKYPTLSNEDTKLYAIAGASAVGLLGGIGIHKLINN